jgi:hypothetical protein
MSYDLNTMQAPCDHAQTAERYVVDTNDFRTLRLAANPAANMRAPINGQALVKLYIRGVLVRPDDPTYGYNIVLDDNRILTSDVFYKIVFKKAVRWFIPLVEVSYVTLKVYCLKCSGSGSLYDLKQGNSGSFTHVTGNDKLVQRVLKFTLTSRCPFYPQFTCKIRDYVGRKFGIGITEADVSNQIIASLGFLKGIQSAQRTIQSLTPQELLKDITSVRALIDPDDPTRLQVAASVSSYGSSYAVPVSFTLTSTRDLVG